MKQKFLNLLLFFLVVSASTDAQDLKVKEMKRVMSDLSASTHQRLDSDGIACGLVKVQVGCPIINFGTSAVGSVENKYNYWCPIKIKLSRQKRGQTFRQVPKDL